MVDLVLKHSNEHKHEEKGRDRKYEHKNTLHKARYYMLSLVVDLFNFGVSCFDVFALQITNFFNDSLIFFELFLKAFCKLLHSLDHLNHICFKLCPLSSLLLFIFVKVNNSSCFFLFMFFISLL